MAHCVLEYENRRTQRSVSKENDYDYSTRKNVKNDAGKQIVMPLLLTGHFSSKSVMIHFNLKFVNGLNSQEISKE